MKRLFLFLSVLALIFPFNAGAHSQSVSVMVDGVNITDELGGSWMDDGDHLWEWSIDPYEGDGFSISQCDVTADEDPFVSYGLAVQNTTSSPMNFSFIFSSDIIPVSDPSVVKSSFGGAVTAGESSAPFGVTLTALNPSHGVIDGDLITEIHVPTVSNDSGLTLTNMGVDLGPTFSYSDSDMTKGIGPYNESGNGPSGGPWNHLQIDVDFNLSGGDWAVLTGRADINAVPIPSAVWLLASGLIGMIGFRRKCRE